MSQPHAHVYDDYSRARIGFFFGLTGTQLAIVGLGVLPALWATSQGRWATAGVLLLAWAMVTALVVTPVRGRSATGWLVAATAHAAGAVAGWARFRSHATRGQVGDLATVDLPGVLSGIEVHEAPPAGPEQRRVAVIQDHTVRTWAVTAAVTHPGIGWSDPATRDRYGAGLADLLDAAARTGLVDEIVIVVRTVPEDGAQRDQWLTRHRRPGAPVAARTVNDELQATLTGASVRTEAFVTVVVPEARIGRDAKEAGGGFTGRAQVLHSVMGEVEAHLRGGLGMSQVQWLTSPELAVACRTGFAPGDRVGIIDALTAAATHGGVNTEVPWALAGPSGADPVVRHYSHDAWNSVSATVKLPTKGAVMGALAPVLTPAQAGERRSFMVAYPIIPGHVADRHSASGAWKADMADGLRAKAKVRQRARSQQESEKVRDLDRKLARGNALTRPYAICTVTVPKTARVAEYGRRLDAAIRSAGFAPLRLDLSQDAAFAASTIPLGTSLTRRGSA
ncbi:SCO6880 family protein [Phycicoccus sonneratiae]|uniref:PrgI family protein n=1 Tax=Phycicoccus sonneratiae TaxID=2807628 RepID=A0ABS2CRU6_9MICO|nr:SCO6880 family protein [Phycicoccus sonneraticus]MBM6402612.1 PrgI family protein [Phycicoccus sonneraticus]